MNVLKKKWIFKSESSERKQMIMNTLKTSLVLLIILQGATCQSFESSSQCKNTEYTCPDGQCVPDMYSCDVSRGNNEDHGLTKEGCPLSRPSKCVGESRCISFHEECDRHCDCLNCTDEDPLHCNHIDIHHHGDVRQGQIFPTGTLLLACMVFVMWSVYVYFKRKIRIARMHHAQAMQVDEPAGLMAPRVVPSDYPIVSVPVNQPNRVININIRPDDANTADASSRLPMDAPPAYSEVVADPQYNPMSSLLQPQGNIPAPPAYEAVATPTNQQQQ